MNKNIQFNLPLIVVFLLSLVMSIQACAQASFSPKASLDDDLSAEELALLADDGLIELTFDSLSIDVEFADTFDKRRLGLMYRRSLCDDCGMLFQFDDELIASIWMKNTFVPLDLAYITVDGIIVDIKPLQPHDLNSVKSSSVVLYALEMNQGWFAKKGIKVGDRVSIEGRVKQPKRK